jgi:hypothetical protein
MLNKNSYLQKKKYISLNDQKSTKNKLNSLMVVGWLMELVDGVG